MTRRKLAVVGCGHLGTIHARLLAAREDVELIAVVDPGESASRLAALHNCLALADAREIVGQVDAAVIAAPTGLHAAVAIPLLESGIDLLIEKPLAATVEEARAIVIAARRAGRTVAVGHVERFNPDWTLARAHIGKPWLIEAVRQAPFTFRSLDVGAVLDLMIHDIDLVLSFDPGKLESVEAHGYRATGGHEDILRARLSFRSGVVADLLASRIHPSLRRSVSLWTDAGYVAVDFNGKAVDVMGASDAVKSGRFIADDVPMAERAGRKERFFADVLPCQSLPVADGNAIALEHEDFLASIRGGRPPMVTAAAAAAALEVAARILEVAEIREFGVDCPMRESSAAVRSLRPEPLAWTRRSA